MKPALVVITQLMLKNLRSVMRKKIIPNSLQPVPKSAIPPVFTAQDVKHG